MTDLEERFRSLGRTPAPDLWNDIDEREPRHMPGPSLGRRFAAAAVALVVGAAGVGVAVWAIGGNERGDRPVAVVPEPVIAYTSGVGGYHIATVTLDGVVTDLTMPTGDAYDLGSAWAPDGDAIAFLRYTRGDYELVVTDADGHPLADFDRTAIGFSWSPDGSQIVFSTVQDGTDHDIVVATLDGTETRVVVHSPLTDANPAWSPIGGLIAFTSAPVLDRDPGDEDVYVVRPDGTDLTRLTGSRGPDQSPVWSPDGARIAYLGEQDGEREVFVMNTDGTGRVAVSDAPANDITSPVWAPDGSMIAFGVFSGTDWDVFVVDADGTDQMLLAGGPKDEVGPAWAPDGSMIAYSAAQAAESCRCDNSGTFDIYVVKPDGSDRRRLTEDARELGGDLSWRPLPD
jgi:Tol biopolymer transport system component